MELRNIGVSTQEYRERREQVLESLEGAVAVVFAGNEVSLGTLQGRWKTDRLFYYLAGIDYESGAAIVFDPNAEDPGKRITLFLRSRDPEVERWDGVREPLDSALKAKTGFTSILRSPYLPGRLTDAARRSKRLACLHPFSVYNADVSPDFAVFKKICERVPGVAIEDRTQILPAMRAVKSSSELALIERAVVATTAGYEAALRFIRPGVTECAIEQTLTAAFREQGGEPAFEPIVGSGFNSTVLHYIDNDQVVQPGDLIVIDYAAAYGGYASDVTRTLPANGVFTPQQRAVYEIVLEANLSAAAAARSGASAADLQNAARAVIERAGYGDYFIHGVSHQLGLEVHDVTPDGPLVSGMVVTIEPGIYLPHEKLGVRIEDDILITDAGSVNLTAAIPKTVDDIQAAMARG